MTGADDSQWLRVGTAAYGRASLALFLAGFVTFSLLYSVQPLLPEFSLHFDLSPAKSAMALSVATAALAFSIVLAGVFSQRIGRRGIMFASMASASCLNAMVGFLDHWPSLLVARALEGFLLGGVPAVAMAYVAEEVHPRDLGRAMGLYVAGTALGGMIGRIGVGIVAEHSSWQVAMNAHGALCLLTSAAFLALLPPSRHFVPSERLSLGRDLVLWAEQLRNTALLALFGISFAIMGVFVSIYNYAGFRLAAPPFLFSQTAISLIFLAYGLGAYSSSLAGRLADRHGRRKMLGIGLAMMLFGGALTLPAGPIPVILGMVILTCGFFAAHSVASCWVGALAGSAKGHAASLYLLAYYLGSSGLGIIGGWFWQAGGWAAVIAMTSGLCLLALGLCRSVRQETEP